MGKLKESDQNVIQLHLDNCIAMISCFYAPKYENYLKHLMEEKGEQLVFEFAIPWVKEMAHFVIYLKLLANATSNSFFLPLWY
jgi:hypothetical protein